MSLSSKKLTNYISRALKVDRDKLYESFFPAGNDDFDAIIELRKSLFSQGAPWDDEKYLKWRYCFDDNCEGENRLWIFKNNNGILGYIGLEKLTIAIQGKLYSACKTMDLFVKQQLDGIGLGVWMSLVIREKHSILCAVGSNENSFPIASKIYHEMQLRKTFKLFLSTRAPLKRKLKSAFLADMISKPFDYLLSRYQCHRIKIPEEYTIKILQDIPDAVDHFPLLKDRIYALRNRSYLTWRFLNNPRRKYLALGLYKLGKLKAISFPCMIYSSTNEQKEAFIADWVIDEADSTDMLQTFLFQKTVKYLKSIGAKLIHVSVFDMGSSHSLLKLGFIQREEAQTFFTYTSQPNLQPLLYDNDKWLLTEGDSDTEMF